MLNKNKKSLKKQYLINLEVEYIKEAEKILMDLYEGKKSGLINSLLKKWVKEHNPSFKSEYEKLKEENKS